jgi:hypothetical protein
VAHVVVSVSFRWDEYPGLRPGRIFSGQGDLGRRPLGETHIVAGEDAVQTVCGLPRKAFPHDFPASADLALADSCATCVGSTGATPE